MSELDETIGTLKKLNPRTIRDMSYDDMQHLHMELMPTHHNTIIELQESIFNLQTQLNQHGNEYDEIIQDISTSIANVESYISREKIKITTLDKRLESYSKQNIFLKFLVIIMIVACIAQWYFIIYFHTKPIILQDNVEQTDTDNSIENTLD